MASWIEMHGFRGISFHSPKYYVGHPVLSLSCTPPTFQAWRTHIRPLQYEVLKSRYSSIIPRLMEFTQTCQITSEEKKVFVIECEKWRQLHSIFCRKLLLRGLYYYCLLLLWSWATLWRFPAEKNVLESHCIFATSFRFEYDSKKEEGIVVHKTLFLTKSSESGATAVIQILNFAFRVLDLWSCT